MSHKFGFPAMTNRALGNKSSTPNVPSSQGGKFLVRVIDIILDENHPKYNQSAGLNQIGQITGESVSPDNTVKPKVYIASPASSNLKNLPLVNEYVYVYKIVGPNSKGGQWVYDPPLSLYRGLSPNSNPFPSPTYNSNPPSQNVNYSQIEAGAVNITDNQPQSINLNSIDNPSQATFVEKGNIHPLMPFAGDIIYEGRFSNSLRFGNTAKSKSQYANNWSSAGNNGDPITILRNGQPTNASSEGWIPITENIKNDLSSIYLTSTQKIPFSLANENFNSYSTPPIIPSSFTSPQIILHSNRVVLNAKSDSVLISGQSSIGLSSNGSINAEANQIYFSSNNIRLGSKNATQPVLKGDDTVDVLIQLTKAIKDLASILQVQRDYPEGNLVTSYNSIAGNVLDQITNPTNGILVLLTNNSLKSQTTKVQ
jgi:hypothetical protein